MKNVSNGLTGDFVKMETICLTFDIGRGRTKKRGNVFPSLGSSIPVERIIFRINPVIVFFVALPAGDKKIDGGPKDVSVIVRGSWTFTSL